MNTEYKTIDEVIRANFHSIPKDPRWDNGDVVEPKMHRIHAYPAKFPAFITTKALELLYRNNSPKRAADVFCGCGTVALEAKRNGIDFWGCDINPVATLIAKVKSENYDKRKLVYYLGLILDEFKRIKISKRTYEIANERLKYWFSRKRFEDLEKLKKAIKRVTPANSKYRLFYLCAFSNVLKICSRWLTKSIKPQKDPFKKRANVLNVFKKHCSFMIKASDENKLNKKSKTKIMTSNFLSLPKLPSKVDMIITSPPYATSYEYADLHQLSTLWLDFVQDYRELRKGTIGSRYHLEPQTIDQSRLNITGSAVVKKLKRHNKEKANEVSKYFLDMQMAAKLCKRILRKHGNALFVIGNTEFKGVRIDNARHLAESLLMGGFKSVSLSKRNILGKSLTPYRDNIGKFTNDKNSRKVYAEEFILIGKN